MASNSNALDGGHSGDQIVPEARVEENHRKRVTTRRNVPECVAVVHKAFLTTLKQTSNENFRRKFLLDLQANNTKEASEKLSALLNNLSQNVHDTDPIDDDRNATLNYSNDSTPPSSGSLCASQGLNEANNLEQEIAISMFPNDDAFYPATTSTGKQSKASVMGKDVDWFEELLAKDSDI